MDIYLALALLTILIAIGLLIYGLWGMIRWKGRRKVGLFIILGSIIGTTILVVILATFSSTLKNHTVESAHKAGFSSVENYKNALAANITNPVSINHISKI